jgi:thiol-disulfide isomerase/thioredoxin
MIPILLATMSLALLSACGGDGDSPENPTPSVLPEQLIGQQMPEATGENLTGTGTSSLSTFKGVPLVVPIWLNACPDCQKEMPRLQALAGTLQGVKFVSLAVDDPEANGSGPKGYETPPAFVKTAGLTMPTLQVPRTELDSAFNLYRIPTVFLVDSAGVVAKTFVWPFTTAEVESAARALK